MRIIRIDLMEGGRERDRPHARHRIAMHRMASDSRFGLPYGGIAQPGRDVKRFMCAAPTRGARYASPVPSSVGIDVVGPTGPDPALSQIESLHGNAGSNPRGAIGGEGLLGHLDGIAPKSRTVTLCSTRTRSSRTRREKIVNNSSCSFRCGLAAIQRRPASAYIEGIVVFL